MHRFLIFLPWIIAIAWSLSSKNFFISGFLLLGATWQSWVIRKLDLSFRRILIHIIMQFCWIFSAVALSTPLIFLGLYMQSLSYIMIEKTFAKERKKYETKIVNYEQQIDLLYELRKQRHDLQKHTAALQYSNEVELYKDELYSRYVDIDQILKNESNIVAGTLFSYRKQAQEKNIELEYNFQQAISGLPFSEYELVSFIGNILQNAMEANIEYFKKAGQHKRIIFSCRKQSGIWIIVCQNYTVPIENNVIERMFTKRAKTTKGGTHEGIGTQQIMKITKSYGGSLDFSVIKNRFTLKIKIPDFQ